MLPRGFLWSLVWTGNMKKGVIILDNVVKFSQTWFSSNIVAFGKFSPQSIFRVHLYETSLKPDERLRKKGQGYRRKYLIPPFFSFKKKLPKKVMNKFTIFKPTVSNYFTPIMTPLLWTIQALDIRLRTSSSADHHKGRRDWSCFTNMFCGHHNLSPVCRNRANIKHVKWRTFTYWRWQSRYKKPVHKPAEATWWTLGAEIYSRRSSAQTAASPTLKSSE